MKVKHRTQLTGIWQGGTARPVEPFISDRPLFAAKWTVTVSRAAGFYVRSVLAIATFRGRARHGVAAAFPDFFVTGSLSDMLTLPHWPLRRDGAHGRGRTGGASVRGSGSSSTGNEEQWLQLSLQSVEVSLYLVSKTEWKTSQDSSEGFENGSEKPSWFWLELTSGTGEETMTPSVKPGDIVVLSSLSIWSQRQSE